MQTHTLIQGSPEWAAHRAKFKNASDAPVMLGCSPYKTRQQLLKELSTGLSAEVDPALQARFDAGHRFEALARPLAEGIIGDDLAPVVASEGEYSASFDGLTLMSDVAFEHKSLNNELRNVLGNGCTTSEIPKHYRVQMEQQCMVAGCEKVLFMATQWAGDDLVEERHCWYYPDPVLRAEIVAGWRQFDADLAAYSPAEPAAPAVVAVVQPSLPAVVVRMDGALTVASNLPDFAVALRAFIANIPAKPSTDQEFADAESACKALKSAEAALEQAENNALSQMTDVEQMRRVVGDLRTLSKTTRLATEKLVAARKEAIRTEIYQEGIAAYKAHIDGLNKRIGRQYMPVLPVDFAGAIKNKRTVDSLRDAVNTHLANAKIAANDVADRIQINMTTLRELAAGRESLFPDTAQLVLKGNDDLTALVKTRIAEHEKAETDRLERQRAQIAEEERVKAEAKVRAEAEDALIASIWANARRIEGDSVAYINKAIDHFESGAGAYGHDKRPRVTAAVKAAREELVGKLTAAEARESARATATPPPPPPQDQPVAEAKPTIFEELASTPAYQATRVADAQATATPHPPTMNLGKISAVLGFTVNAAFLQQIGCHPAKTERASFLYHDRDILTILEALGAHLQAVYSAQKAKYQPARTRTAA